MEQNNCLGIYISKTKAAAVLLSSNAAHPALLGSCSVAQPRETSQGELTQEPSLAALLAARLASAGFRYGEVCVGIDSALYTQHNLRSDFSEHKQIAGTIMFDAEEALARDATEMALTFSILASDENGSRVSVFTADRGAISTMLNELQRESLDPVAIEPDTLCLARCLEHYFSHPQTVKPLFVVLGNPDANSGAKCYMIHPQGHHRNPLVRSFIIGASQNATAVLQREIPLTLAAMNLPEPPGAIFLAAPPDAIDAAKLTERTGIDTQIIDLSAMTGVPPDETAPTEFAVACGAALAQVKHIRPNDFRRSFAPYQGKRLIMQKALRAISIMATISLVVLGAYLQLKIFRKHNSIAQLEKNLVEDYRAVMYGADPPRNISLTRRLETEYMRLKKEKEGGIADESSVPAKLTYMLEAINSIPNNVDLNVSTINLAGNRMSLRGDTDGRASTLTLFRVLTEHPKLQKVSERLDQKGFRDVFTIDLELTKGMVAPQ